MINKTRKYWSRLAVGVIFIIPAIFYLVLSFGNHRYTRLPYYAQEQITSTNLENAYFLDNVSLLQSDSSSFNRAELDEKIILWNAIHTHDYILSPAIIANLQFIQDRFNDRKDILIISLVTNNSDHTQIADYAKTLNIDQYNWRILHSDSTNIRRFLEEQLFINYKKLPDSLSQVVPSNEIILMDKNAHIRGYFDGGIHKEIKGKLVDAIDMLAREEFVVYRENKKK